MADQGETYAKFIDSELKTEYERRTALNVRAVGIASSSSAFLALVFGLSIIVTGKDYKFSEWGARGLVVSLALFVAASVLGLFANASLGYQVVSQETLTSMVGKDHWIDPEVDARNVCADLNARTIGSLRLGNDKTRHR